MTEQEREEYRLAALAACFDVREAPHNDSFLYVLHKGGKVWLWHPKTDKAHSFDLMLDAKITLDPEHGASVLLADGETFHVEPINGNPMLAIFRCAVAKGRAIERAAHDTRTQP